MKHKRMNEKKKEEKLNTFGNKTKIDQNEIIFSPEKKMNEAFYLLDGFIEVINRETCVSRLVGPGEFFGDRSIFESDVIYAEALTPVHLIRIDGENFNRLLYSDANLAMDITASLSKHHLFLTNKQNVLSQVKELFSHMKKRYPIKFLLKSQKKKGRNGSVCCSN
ncbi:Crp/Fnr family transcriptional regulator [Salirhabdus euzebyi]|uniref:Crp/Fnr family transcriptional regulator n=1 Tax=Salirhabdus euzebyi TaxID=394506 RepID=UPI00157A6877|nr:cyclic nucleotide-binding domain-containing protein [Salirhabdus euzebyi]